MATIETLYSKGDIDPLPDIGPQRPDISFEKKVLEEREQKPISPKKNERELYIDKKYTISGSFWAYVIITIITAIISAFFEIDSIFTNSYFSNFIYISFYFI